MQEFNKYVGIPYLLGGRDEKGIDCWGLVRLVYKEQYDIDLPSLVELYPSESDTNKVYSKLAEEIALRKEQWEEVQTPEVGNVVLLRSSGYAVHVGIYIGEGKFLHAFGAGSAIIEKLSSVHWRNRIVGYFKYNEKTLSDFTPKAGIFSEGVANPFRNVYLAESYPLGTSLEDIIKGNAKKAGYSEELTLQGLAWVDGTFVPQDLWSSTYPLANARVEFRIIASGGGSLLKTIAAIAISFAAPHLAVGLLGSAAGTVGALTTAGMIASAGISILGTMLLGAIFPVRPPQQSNSLSTGKAYYSLSNGGNQTNQYGAIPVVLGAYRFAGPLASTPWVQTINNEKYLRMNILWGYGPLAVSDFRIGANKFSSYDDTQLETIQGRVGEDKTDFNSLCGRSVSQTSVGIVLEYNVPVERTIDEDSTRIQVNLTAQNGIFRINSKGDYKKYSTSFKIRYKLTSSSTWYDFGPNVMGRSILLPTSPVAKKHTTEWSATTAQALSYTWFNVYALDGSIEVVNGGNHPSLTPYMSSEWVPDPVSTGDGTYQDVTIDPVPDWPSGSTKLYQICIMNDPNTTTVGDEVVKVHQIKDLRTSTTGFDLVVNAAATAATIDDGHIIDVSDEVIITGAGPDVIDKVVSRTVPLGKYTVEVTRKTKDSTETTIVDKVTLTSITGYSNKKPISPRVPMAMSAIKIKSSNQLNGNLEGISAFVQSICLDYVNSTIGWREQTTSNPASLYRYVLQHPANPRPKTDAEIDLEALADWHIYCKTNGFEYNNIILQQRSVDDILRDIAAAGRASPSRPNGLYSVVIDRPNSSISHHFTPHNSWGFSGSKRFPRLPHALRITFPNEERDFQPDERFVYNDGYSKANATEIESIELPGITNTNLIHKHARFHMAQAALRPEEYTINCDIEHIICTRGDRVKVTHDVPMWGLGSGRVKELNLSGSDVIGITLDESLPMTAGVTYALRYRLSTTGESYVVNVSPVGLTGYYDTLVFTTAITTNKPVVDDLVMFGEVGSESIDCIVQNIEPSGNETARITLVDYAPALAVVDTEEIPAWESNITLPPGTNNQQITKVPTKLVFSSDERSMLRLSNGSYSNGLSISWTNPSGLTGNVDFVEIQYGIAAVQNGTWSRVTTKIGNRSYIVNPVTLGESYDIRLRYISDNGAVGKWVYGSHIVTGALLPPDDVEGFAINVVSDTATLTWKAVSSLNLANYRLRFSPLTTGVTWQSSSDLINEVPASSTSVIVPAMKGTYLIKAVDDTGKESNNPSLIVTNAAGITQLNLIHSIDESPAWPGTKTLTWSSFDGLRLDSVDTLDDWPTLEEVLNLAVSINGLSLMGNYQFAEEFGLGAVYKCRITSELEVTADNISNVMTSWASLDILTNIAGDVSGEFDAWLEISTAQDDDPEGSPTWSDWSRFVVGDYLARAFRFRVILESQDTNVTPVVSRAKVTIDMPDRIISLTDILCPNTGLAVVYPLGFRARPAVAISAEDMDTGDYYRITSADENGFTIQFFDSSATGVARTFDYLAKGYGENTI